MSEKEILPVMRLEAEKLLDGDGEYAVDFVKPGWLAECRRTGGTFLLYPQISVDALAAQRDEGLAREAVMQKQLGELWQEISTLNQSIESAWTERDVLQQRLAEAEKGTFQARVLPWMNACFGEQISADKQERNHRFLEEALELVQACGATAEEAHQLVDYVYGRPVGEPSQEVGGVMVTLAALCLAQGMNMHQDAETELARIWGKVEQIRAKQAAKPAFGPLPGSYPERLTSPGCADGEKP